MIVPGGGLSLKGTRWVACRPGFFLHVRVLSRLFRRLFLEGMRDLHRAGQLAFFGDLAKLARADTEPPRVYWRVKHGSDDVRLLLDGHIMCG